MGTPTFSERHIQTYNAVKQLLVPDFPTKKKKHQASGITHACEISSLKSIEVPRKKLQIADRTRMSQLVGIHHNKIYYPTNFLINDDLFLKSVLIEMCPDITFSH